MYMQTTKVENIELTAEVAQLVAVELTNDTDAPKKLTFESHCGCTVPKSDVEIAPKKSTNAEFTITKRKAGDFSQTVTVYEVRGAEKFQVGSISFSGTVQ
jgi:hypothetical protein